MMSSISIIGKPNNKSEQHLQLRGPAKPVFVSHPEVERFIDDNPQWFAMHRHGEMRMLEIRDFYSRAVVKGSSSIWSARLNDWDSAFRKTVLPAFIATGLVVRSGAPIISQSKTRGRCARHSLPGGAGDSKSSPLTSPGSLGDFITFPWEIAKSRGFIAVDVDPDLYAQRSRRWTWSCAQRNLDPVIDHAGITQWGKATQDALRAVVLPEKIDCPDVAPKKRKRLKKLLFQLKTRGAKRTVKRFTRSRLFHALTGVDREMRSELQMKYRGTVEPTVIIDMHATFPNVIASMLPDCPDKHKLVAALQNDFWESMSNGTDRDTLKKQFNAQVLFFKWKWPKQRLPVWLAFEEAYPAAAEFILELRHKMTASQLYYRLTHTESTIFIDGALLELSNQQVPCLTYHDAVQVPASQEHLAHTILRACAAKELGHLPKFKVERPSGSIAVNNEATT